MNKYSLLLMSILLLSACDVNEKKDTKTLQAELTKQRTLFKEQNLTYYRYTIKESCFCPPPLNKIVEVSNDTVEDAYDLSTYKSIDSTNEKSMEGLFDQIEYYINDNPYNIAITYDKEGHFPTSFSVDPLKGAQDDEYSFSLELNTPIMCTAVSVYGVRISLFDKDDNSSIACGTSIDINSTQDDYYEQISKADTQECDETEAFVGLGEKAGEFIITVNKESYQTFTTTVKLDKTICHVINQDLNFYLEKK